MSELDPVRRQSEQLLRGILRDFVFAFRGLSRIQIPAVSVRVTDRPQEGSPALQKEMTVTRQVFDAFEHAVNRDAQTSPENPEHRYLRVNSFGNPNHPWFDISIEAGERVLIFRVIRVHGIDQLSSAKAS
ncbi:hypothetical protein M0Q28_00940 [Patescibacteria group bacterium]|jgi:hypothetical protein|nr:hypothetical protein [Patescibacteria group bacterium]